MMVKNILVSLFIIMALAGHAQDGPTSKVAMMYDESGNRTRRIIEVTLAKTREIREPLKHIIDSVLNPVTLDSTLQTTVTANQYHVSVYPNPAVDELVIQQKQDNVNVCTFMLYDLSGKLIMSGTFSEWRHKLDISSYKQGDYFLIITGSENKTVWKILKH